MAPLFHKYFHDWLYLTDWQKDDTKSGGCVVHAEFRHCKECGVWEREYYGWDDSWWEECLEPIGVERLDGRNEAKAEMHRVRLQHDRWTVIDGH